jgi:hypothetical protein
LDSATTPNLSEKKTDYTPSEILFSLDLWCSTRLNYTYYSSNCPIDMMSKPMDKIQPAELNKSTTAYCKAKLQRKKKKLKKKKEKIGIDPSLIR